MLKDALPHITRRYRDPKQMPLLKAEETPFPIPSTALIPASPAAAKGR